jgi:dynein heavy chain
MGLEDKMHPLIYNLGMCMIMISVGLVNSSAAWLQVSEVLEQWLQLQRGWMYLEPIFSSPDIMQQLPLEGKRFAAVDRSWRKTLDAARKNPNLIKVWQTT